MFPFVAFSLLFTLISFQYCAGELPPYLLRCCVKDPDLNNCLLNVVNLAKPSLVKGIKEIRLSKIDQIVVPMFSLLQEAQGINYNATFHNFSISGFHNYNIQQIRYNPDTLELQGKAEFPPILINTTYDIKGKLLFFDVVGKGTVSIHLEPVNGTFEISGKLRKGKNVNYDEDYYNPTAVKIRMTLPGFNIKVKGLVSEDEELVRLTTNMINENAKELAYSFTPILEKLMEYFLMKEAKSITKTVPYNKLLPC